MKCKPRQNSPGLVTNVGLRLGSQKFKGLRVNLRWAFWEPKLDAGKFRALSNPVKSRYEWGGNKGTGSCKRRWHCSGGLICRTPCCRMLWMVVVYEGSAGQTHGREIPWRLIFEINSTNLWSFWTFHEFREWTRSKNSTKSQSCVLCIISLTSTQSSKVQKCLQSQILLNKGV